MGYRKCCRQREHQQNQSEARALRLLRPSWAGPTSLLCPGKRWPCWWALGKEGGGSPAGTAWELELTAVPLLAAAGGWRGGGVSSVLGPGTSPVPGLGSAKLFAERFVILG